MATQICDRVITYRNFDYARAETIIQEEEYLDQEDFDDIRFYQRQGNILEDIEKGKEKYGRNSKDEFFATFKKNHHREKREDLSTNVVIPTYITDKLKLCYNTYNVVETCRICLKNCELGSGYDCCSLISSRELPCSEAERYSGDGSDYNVFRGNTVLPYSTISWPCIMVKIILILSIKCVLMGEQCPLHPGRPPIDPPLVPRCPDDPNCPLFNNPNNVLDLVPPGLTPVATFPPFSRFPRTVDAEAVIWREPPGTVPGERLPDDGRGGIEFRKKRHASYCPQKSFLEKFWLNIRCYKPRMEARLKQNSHGNYCYVF